MTSSLQLVRSSALWTAASPVPRTPSRPPRTSQPWQNGQWKTERPQRSPTPGSSGGRLGVLGTGEAAVHRALLLTSWSDDVTVYSNGEPPPAEPALAVAGVAIDERRIAALAGPGTELGAVRFADGSERACDALLVAVTLHQRSGLAAQLGAELAEPGPIAADAIVADERGITTVPGLFAAGDVTARMPSVANAVASGSNAAAAVVQHLTAAPARD